MGLDVVIPLIVLAICLLPNLLLIWGARRLHVSDRLGTLSRNLAALSLAAACSSYLLVTQYLLMFSLLTAIPGAATALIAIDYFLVKEASVTKIIGVIAYFIVLVFCETIIFGVAGHM